MGSLGLGTSVAHIHYNNIYLVNSGGFYVKTNGGTGTLLALLPRFTMLTYYRHRHRLHLRELHFTQLRIYPDH